MKIASGLIAAGAALLLAAPALQAEEAEEPAKTEGQLKLEKLLEGRVAGKPEQCIRNFPSTDLTIIDGTALVYKSGGTLWVNIPRNADDIDDDDTLVTRTSASRLCRTDIVTTIDRFSQFYTGNIFLGDFVPYRRADS